MKMMRCEIFVVDHHRFGLASRKTLPLTQIVIKTRDYETDEEKFVIGAAPSRWKDQNTNYHKRIRMQLGRESIKNDTIRVHL
jgi:hypothetical protein